ncbi:MAG: helix-turn-helix domain-containing protein [Pseudonocardia sp.]|nr:helix-turn-helix domain-containing protein [Pseudonocardia sp.]
MARESEVITELRRALGAQLATFRLAAELTQGQLAKAAACDRTAIVHTEKGRARGDERFWRAVDAACQAGGVLLAAYLELEAARAEHDQRQREQRLRGVRARAAELREQVGRAGDPVSSAPQAADSAARRFLPEVISRLSAVMLAAGRPGSTVRQSVANDDNAVLALPELTTCVKRAWHLRQVAAYATLGGHLARLIPEVEASVSSFNGDAQYAALQLMVHTYNATSSLLKRLGDIELALLAADRAVRTAQALDDLLLVAAAHYRLANVLLTAARLDAARQVTLQAADAVAPGKAASPLSLASWGGLLLTGAVAAARLGDAPGAWELLGEARTASRLLGVDYAGLHTIFGPTNVAIHSVQVAAELGNGHDAVRRGARVNADRLPLSLNERRSQFLIDLAHGHVITDSDGPATERLLQAEQAAPEEVRFNPTVHELVGTMLARERLSATPGLRGLARRINVER